MRLFEVKTRALAVIRDRGRQVLFTEPGQGIGNLLYLYLHAWRDRTRGVDSWVLEAPQFALWRDAFPGLQALTLPRARLRLSDGRDLEAYQGFGTEFTAADLAEFGAELLQSTSLHPPDYGLDTVSVNVRRGDYFSDSRWRALYAIDTVAYVREALAVAAAQGPFGKVRLISDDRDWCRDNLLPMLHDSWEVDLDDRPPSPHTDLAELIGSRRLVLANSTFSYWGGFLSNAVHGDNHRLVIAPWFHRRDINDGASWHLDPRWTLIRDLNGWQAV